MTSKPCNHTEYTIGWVCALPKKQTAATAMLDQRHPDLPKPPNDHNTYTLGSIGKHNVVIACLPKGKIGNNVSATIATRMLSTFPSIKFGLMVGIGGGIPPKIRLGDVVVGTPIGEFPGVVQWDMGKAENGGNFKRTGALNNPPSVLLTALAKLGTEHEMNGSKIPQYLDDLKRNWPKLAPKYLRSNSLKDVLLAPDNSQDSSDYGWGGLWVTISMLWWIILNYLKYVSGLRNVAPREGRAWYFGSNTRNKSTIRDGDQKSSGLSHEETNNNKCQVHYGLIASGNQVIKDAKFRDKLNKDLGGDVLCVEMETAGLANDFPCVAIRGICDYADSSKNKDWQEYAAAVAAALAKELLSIVVAQEVEQMPAIKSKG
jgi:nucleoside phosphorylase